jgi:hypothetical protein
MGENEHRPVNWFTRGVYPSCSCGFAPRNNTALNEHWADKGIRYVDVGGVVKAHSAERPATVTDLLPHEFGVNEGDYWPDYLATPGGAGGVVSEPRSLAASDPEPADGSVILAVLGGTKTAFQRHGDVWFRAGVGDDSFPYWALSGAVDDVILLHNGDLDGAGEKPSTEG